MKTHVLPATKLLAPSDRRTHTVRRIIAATVVAALLIELVRLQRSGLQSASLSTGYALLTAVVMLIALHWRKQAPSLPLGKVSIWLQYHVYLGYLTILLFGLHVAFRLPSGILDTALFGVFCIVASSGLYGLYITRAIPRQLRVLPREVIYEQIPARLREVREQARRVILAAAGDSEALTGFYKMKLAPFIEERRSLGYFLYPNSRRRRLLTAQLRELPRYLSEARRSDCRQLEQLLGEKDDLDFHAALQGRLKVWTYVHIGFSYSLLLLGAVHGLLAHAFSGGVR